MKEEELLEDIFGGAPTFKGLRIIWCDLCEVFALRCLDCTNISCSGGGCDKCREAVEEFDKYKRSPLSYLNKEERVAYEKGRRLRRLMKDSLAQGDKEIDWQKMETQGKFSDNDHNIYFVKETKDLIPFKNDK